MINPNGDEFMEDDPLAASMRSSEERASEQNPGRLRQATDKVSTLAGGAWEQTNNPAAALGNRKQALTQMSETLLDREAANGAALKIGSGCL